jgi:hypothetical protein
VTPQPTEEQQALNRLLKHPGELEAQLSRIDREMIFQRRVLEGLETQRAMLLRISGRLPGGASDSAIVEAAPESPACCHMQAMWADRPGHGAEEPPILVCQECRAPLEPAAYGNPVQPVSMQALEAREPPPCPHLSKDLQVMDSGAIICGICSAVLKPAETPVPCPHEFHFVSGMDLVCDQCGLPAVSGQSIVMAPEVDPQDEPLAAALEGDKFRTAELKKLPAVDSLVIREASVKGFLKKPEECDHPEDSVFKLAGRGLPVCTDCGATPETVTPREDLSACVHLPAHRGHNEAGDRICLNCAAVLAPAVAKSSGGPTQMERLARAERIADAAEAQPADEGNMRAAISGNRGQNAIPARSRVGPADPPPRQEPTVVMSDEEEADALLNCNHAKDGHKILMVGNAAKCGFCGEGVPKPKTG